MHRRSVGQKRRSQTSANPGGIVGQKGEKRENRREEAKELVESERPSDELFAWPKMTMVAFRTRPPMIWADK